MLTDPIADLLTRIRNAAGARKPSVDIPWSRLKEKIARVLVAEGYLASSTMIEAQPQPVLRVELRYDPQRRPVINGIRRVSRPSLRVYVGVDEIRRCAPGSASTSSPRPKGSWSTATRAASTSAARSSARSGR
jgi:small subunit ribosomal protein S8